jgi:cell division control protein 6
VEGGIEKEDWDMNLFESFPRESKIFNNREYLKHTYIPEKILHREEQIQLLAKILAAPLRGEVPSNVIIYGKTGTGKTVVTRFVLKELEKASASAPLKVIGIYMNCASINTQYRILSRLASFLLEDLREKLGPFEFQKTGLPERIPTTGWPTDHVLEVLIRALEYDSKLVIVALDEIDKLLEGGSEEVLYQLSRLNCELSVSRISLIGISNSTGFLDHLDPRVRSSLGETQIVFPPYNALQLTDILEERARLGFKEGVLAEGVTRLCAALAAREHGDARKALDLLRTAGEVAEEKGSDRVELEHVKEASERLQKSAIEEVLRTLPLHQKLVLLAIVMLKQNGCRLSFGEIYRYYKRICEHNSDLTPVSPRAVKNYLDELDMLGIISTCVVSRGRGGRATEVLDLTYPHVRELLTEETARFELPPLESKLCRFLS